MKYREGYKYQLSENHLDMIGIIPPTPIATHFISLSMDGELFIKADYAWDGCSGPTWDDETNMTAGLEHDALYQLMREGHLPHEYKKAADMRLYEVCLKNGMNSVRAWIYYRGVRGFGESSTLPRLNEVKEVP
jgi:hypothetical protein